MLLRPCLTLFEGLPSETVVKCRTCLLLSKTARPVVPYIQENAVDNEIKRALEDRHI